MRQPSAELREFNIVSTGAVKVMGILCVLGWFASSSVGYCGSIELDTGIAFAGQASNSKTTQSEPGELKQGQLIERELAGGQAHTYRVSLTPGQYLRVAVEQKGIDVVVSLFAPDGQKLIKSDNNPAAGEESVFVVAEASGDYKLEVRSSDKFAANGRYDIKIEEFREATPKDRITVAAEKAFDQANELRDQRTAESRGRAIEKYGEALQLWRDAGDKRGEAYTLNEIGFVYSNLGNPKKALEYYSQALPLWRTLGDKVNEASVLNNIGGVYWRFGELQRSLELRTEALALARAVGDRTNEATILSNIGAVYISMGRLREALHHLDQALPIREAIGDKARIAFTLNGIASCYSGLGEHEKALEVFTRALALSRAAGDRRIEATILGNASECYRRLGEMERALEHNREALSLARAQGDRRREAYLFNFFGLIYQDMGQPKQAVAYLDQALALWRIIGDKYGEATALSIVGETYLRVGEPQKALDHFNQALSIKRAVGDRYGESYALALIGNSYGQLGEQRKALEFLHQALETTRTTGDQEGAAKVLGSIARAHRALGNMTEARIQNEAALRIIEHSRAKFANQQLRISYLMTRRSFYEFQIDLLMQMHRDHPTAGEEAEALQVSEGARARNLLEILSEAKVDVREGIDPDLLKRERLLQEQLAAKSDESMRLLSGPHTEEQATTARKNVDALLADYQDAQAQIRTKSPQYAALTQPQPLSLKEIQEQVLDKDTLLMEYSLGEERSYLWAVTPTSIKTYVLPKRAEIEAAARRVYELLVAKADALYPEALTTLSRMLLEPVTEQLGRKRLLIVSEGALQYIPFAALPTPAINGPKSTITRNAIARKYRPLIFDHEIVSLPSASVLAVLRRELGARKPASRKLAVLADPVFDKDDQRVTGKINSTLGDGPREKAKETEDSSLPSNIERSTREIGLSGFDRLPLSRREAELITALTSSGESLKALDFTASRKIATSPELGQYQTVHFATHSLLNNQHPELSGIVLSLVDEQGQPQDGFLRLYEIYNLKLKADLVVLSACQTALGKEIKGEGLVGLTRGFMYAGVPRVVASLWKVNDRATAELMERFYHKMLKEGLRPAAALRAAQLSLSTDKQWEAAYYWAGFVLQGEWR